MIHNLEHKHNLPTLPELPPPPRPPGPSLWSRLATFVHVTAFMLGALLIVILMIPLFIIISIPILVFDYVENKARKKRREQLIGPTPPPREPIESSRQEVAPVVHHPRRKVTDFHDDPGIGLVILRFNTAAFQQAITSLEELYGGEDRPADPDAEQPGFRTNTMEYYDLSLPFLVIGTGMGLFRVDRGNTISASPETWRRALAEWRRILEEGEPKLVVLDKDQADWCEPDCVGRLCIEYIPDLKGEE